MTVAGAFQNILIPLDSPYKNFNGTTFHALPMALLCLLFSTSSQHFFHKINDDPHQNRKNMDDERPTLTHICVSITPPRSNRQAQKNESQLWKKSNLQGGVMLKPSCFQARGREKKHCCVDDKLIKATYFW